MRWRAVCAVPLMVLAGAPMGCGREGQEPVDAACLEGPRTVLRALESAPRDVAIGGSSVSGCLRNAEAARDLTEVGTIYLEAVTRLADRAERADDDPQALTELGYLVGAIRKGRVEEQGVSAELVRRLEGEAQRADTSSPAYRRGERAGRTAG